MVNEVNRLIFNALVSGHEVYIAELGTLYIARHEATKLRRNRVVAPSFSLMFTTECRGEALSSIIRQTAGISSSEAEDIARRWLQKTTNDGRVVIEGVGTIANGTITADTELAKRLKGSDRVVELTKQKKGSTLPWVIVVALLLCGVCIGTYLYIYNTRTTVTEPSSNEAISVKAAEVITSENITDYKQDALVSEPISASESEPIPATTEHNDAEQHAEPQEALTTETSNDASTADWREQDVRHYVIFGSYSTLDNANTAIGKITRKNPAAECKILPLGKMHAVAVYGSVDRSECEAFKRTHRSLYKNAWIHTPKRFK